SDAEIGADSHHGHLARLRRRLEDPADLPRLHAAGHARRVQRRARERPHAGVVGAQHGASRLRMLWDVVVPSAMPEMLNGVRTALALSFILLVSSELIVARQGFGALIGYLGDDGNYASMFAVVLTVALLGFAADRLYMILVGRALAWRD